MTFFVGLLLISTFFMCFGDWLCLYLCGHCHARPVKARWQGIHQGLSGNRRDNL